MTTSQEERFWIREARRVCLRYNVALWMTGWLPVVVITSGIATCAILIVRRWGGDWTVVGMALAASWFLGGVIVIFLRRKRFFRIPDALVRLEAAGKMHGALSAAAAGVTDWPGPVAHPADGWRWQIARTVVPLLVVGLLLQAAIWVPLGNAPAERSIPAVPPGAWSEVEAWVETLEQESFVRPEALDELRAQLDALQAQNPESWYEHASLEAGDALHAESAQSLRDMQSQMTALASLLAQLDSAAARPLSDGELNAMAESMAAARSALEKGRLPVSEAFLEKLKNLSPDALRTLTEAQRAELQKELQRGNSACRQCLGVSAAGAVAVANGRTPAPGPSEGEESSAPLTSRDPTDPGTTNDEALSHHDPASAGLPGEVVGMSSGQHNVEAPAPGLLEGGAPAITTAGGEAAWKDALTPDERAAVIRFFQ